jgi:hypothetical protein
MREADATPLRIVTLRAEISELGRAVAQSRRAGLDNAAAQLLLARKRAELDSLIQQPAGEKAAPTKPAQPSG